MDLLTYLAFATWRHIATLSVSIVLASATAVTTIACLLRASMSVCVEELSVRTVLSLPSPSGANFVLAAAQFLTGSGLTRLPVVAVGLVLRLALVVVNAPIGLSRVGVNTFSKEAGTDFWIISESVPAAGFCELPVHAA